MENLSIPKKSTIEGTTSDNDAKRLITKFIIHKGEGEAFHVMGEREGVYNTHPIGQEEKAARYFHPEKFY
jgi:hypothetical protein